MIGTETKAAAVASHVGTLAPAAAVAAAGACILLLQASAYTAGVGSWADVADVILQHVPADGLELELCSNAAAFSREAAAEQLAGKLLLLLQSKQIVLPLPQQKQQPPLPSSSCRLAP